MSNDKLGASLVCEETTGLVNDVMLHILAYPIVSSLSHLVFHVLPGRSIPFTPRWRLRCVSKLWAKKIPLLTRHITRGKGLLQ